MDAPNHSPLPPKSDKGEAESATAQSPPVSAQRLELFGMPFSALTFAQVCREVDARIRSRRPGYIVTPNVDHVCRFHRDPLFREVYRDAFLVLADGKPILWSSHLVRKPLPAKLSGSDLVPLLSQFAAEQGHPVYFFGAADGVANAAARALEQRFRGLKVAGVYSPPMGFPLDGDASDEAVKHLRGSGAAMCFVALGSPKQELWMQRYYAASGVPVMAGIGAGLDFAAGHLRRAPRWMQEALTIVTMRRSPICARAISRRRTTSIAMAIRF